MTPEELHIRATYILHVCSEAIQDFADQLSATFPNPPLSSQLLLMQTLKRELGMLFRYWVTRHVWAQLESNEDLAKQLNITLLRLFTEAFKLPKDGSGLRYAELSTLGEEAQELGNRISYALELTHQPLIAELQRRIASWRDVTIQCTTEALKLPADKLVPKIG